MKKQDLKRHLKSYLIFDKRKTTINHAFASALSVADDYSDKKIDDALLILGQNPNTDLLCVYCNNEAETWDHINALVKNGEFSGFGHQITNLLPCCKKCNSKKGNRDWFSFLESAIQDPTKFKIKKAQIESYIENNSDIRNLIQENCKEELEDFNQIKEQIFELFKKADLIASKIRETVKKSKLD
ncbi:MAG: hypothetical protein WC774_00210 [Candidatus Gracilibacteria bacterium]